MTTIENDVLRVSIRPQGAELTSVFNKQTNIEHLWQADPSVWGWHAPNLFPVVGGLQDDQLRVGDQHFPMGRHGFTRQSVFTLTDATPTSATFELSANSQTLAVYPYQFAFQIMYSLDEAVLSITYRVENKGDQTMYFSVGAHPAFNVPFLPGEQYEDYTLHFQKEEPLTRHLLSPKGYFTGQTEPVLTVGQELPLTKELFNEDALVFKSLESRAVTIQSPHHDHKVVVSFTAFPMLGIWAKPGADFVCIEPWLGCADNEGTPVTIDEKEGIQHVEAGGLFEAGFTIGVA